MTEPDAQPMAATVERVYADGRHLTPNQGGNPTTTEFCEGVFRCL